MAYYLRHGVPVSHPARAPATPPDAVMLPDEQAQDDQQEQQAERRGQHVDAQPGRLAARRAQAVGAGVFGAVTAVAVAAHQAGEGFALVAAGRLELLRRLRPPPAGLLRLEQR